MLVSIEDFDVASQDEEEVDRALAPLKDQCTGRQLLDFSIACDPRRHLLTEAGEDLRFAGVGVSRIEVRVRDCCSLIGHGLRGKHGATIGQWR